ncbi:hypothetical protein OMAG_001467 [Candidatus Omnitrophus magneticus]|uniref:Uncharacterized protein n=1 Tax=Candidatus Omnitrophus magneticus TaxID=1609969 RepID=A0A0F0CRQ1_9BACT|nr:hypothetical protein OMAG_001467 [Candidatus Omnitrophus magneticus]
MSKEYYLPHFYAPSKVIKSNKDQGFLPDILSMDENPLLLAVYFDNQNIGKEKSSFLPDEPNNMVRKALELSFGKEFEGSELYEYNMGDTPVIEYKKINPTKYRVRIHEARGLFHLVFSESFRTDWKAYLTPNALMAKNDINIDEALKRYKILNNRISDQATGDDVRSYLNKGWITSLSAGAEKEKIYTKWVNYRQEVDYVEKYSNEALVDFISKNNHGTIQNDNLPDGDVFETLFSFNQLYELTEETHLKANGYSNAWAINPGILCNSKSSGNTSCLANPDGTFDFEIIVEYYPQRLYYITLTISLTVVFIRIAQWLATLEGMLTTLAGWLIPQLRNRKAKTLVPDEEETGYTGV